MGPGPFDWKLHEESFPIGPKAQKLTKLWFLTPGSPRGTPGYPGVTPGLVGSPSRQSLQATFLGNPSRQPFQTWTIRSEIARRIYLGRSQGPEAVKMKVVAIIIITVTPTIVFSCSLSLSSGPCLCTFKNLRFSVVNSAWVNPTGEIDPVVSEFDIGALFHGHSHFISVRLSYSCCPIAFYVQALSSISS